MKIHILGICGTFMGGIALLARESGVTVTGADEYHARAAGCGYYGRLSC